MRCFYIKLNVIFFPPLFLPILHPSSCWSLRGNVGLSAVCAYSITAVEEVFSKGKYMQKATVEQSHTKWIRHNGITPSPRPGAVSNIHTLCCGPGNTLIEVGITMEPILWLFNVHFLHQCINNLMRQQNISSSLHLPDKTLQFVKDHPLLEDPVLPIGKGPRLIARDVNYTQIVVDRVQALDRKIYDVIFTGTGSNIQPINGRVDALFSTFTPKDSLFLTVDKGMLHKSVVFEGEVHIVEEIQLLKNPEPVKNLLFSSEVSKEKPSAQELEKVF